tara:strand:- start:5619 stop:5834 length:216 start_codon:yes stop_codon:yes gene_type:complete
MRMYTPASGIPQPVSNLEHKIIKKCTEGKMCKSELSERDACISQEMVNRGIFEKEIAEDKTVYYYLKKRNY